MTFSQPMIKWTVENPLNYSISTTVSLTSLHWINDTLVMRLGGLFSQNITYHLSVKHLLAQNMAFLNDTMLSFYYPHKVEQKPLLAWTFDNINTTKPIPADYHLLDTVSEAVLYFDGTYQSDIWLSNELNSFAGTTIGDPRPSPKAGRAIAFANITANGKKIVFKFPTKGYFNLALSMAVQRTATGFDTHEWEWSLDGENYTFIKNSTTCPLTAGSFILTILDLRDIDEVNNQDEVFLRLTFTGCTYSSGNNRLDNITLHGTLINENSTGSEKKNRRSYFITPNPTSGQLRITNYELRDGALREVELYDIYGRKQKTESRKEKGEIVIDISTLSPGIYFLKIETEKEITTRKIVKY
jgi:hypothetical protein